MNTRDNLGPYPTTTFLDRAMRERVAELLNTFTAQGVDSATAFASVRRQVDEVSWSSRK